MVVAKFKIARLRYVKEADYVDDDLSWLDQTDAEMGEGFEAKAAERKEAYSRGDWHMVGVFVEAIADDGWVISRSNGLWNIESDSDDDHFNFIAETERDELAVQMGLEAGALNDLPNGWIER